MDSLADVARRHPVARKLLVVPELGVGRELLRSLARSGVGWIGYEVATPRPLALRIGSHRLRDAGLRPMDPFDQQALLDESLDGAIAAGTWKDFSELSEGVGFREHVHGAVAALRLAGVSAGSLDDARLRDWKKRRFVLGVLERYEGLLAERGRADTATVYTVALEVLEAEEAVALATGAALVLLAPGLGTRGLAGRLIETLRARGAHTLQTDPVVGLDAPESIVWAVGPPASPHAFLHAPKEPDSPQGDDADIEVFHAASPTAELREVARRVQAFGLRWDQVEVVALDPAAYGSAMHALGARLGIAVTYAVGLPLERTRTGRVVDAYLEWVESGFQAAPIRRLLESGDLRPPDAPGAPAPADLARRFRSLRVGWGRERYARQIAGALEGVDRTQRGAHESERAFELRRARERSELAALEAILLPTLEATPAVPDRAAQDGRPVTPSELARGLASFLERAPAEEGPDGVARERISEVLDRVEATLRRPTDFAAALTILRRHLAVRVPAPDPSGPDDVGAPWSSEGGHLHLSDLEHGGYAGREAVFVVGADADRLPGGEAQDPLLLDADRRLLGEDLPLASELLAERVFRFAAFFARLRGSVCLSFSAWDAAEARAIAPSAALLRALRLARRDDALTFEDLRRALGRVASVVPASGRAPLDEDDVWMRAIGGGGLMRSGTRAVRASFPRLDRGLAAREERRSGNPGLFHGVIPARPDELDPRRRSELVVSASRLEALGACPLKYLHRDVMRVRPPDDFDFDPDTWLDPLRRGGVLHAVFEHALRAAREAGVEMDDEAFEDVMLDMVQRAVRRARVEIPSPGDAVVRREVAGLEEDGRSFARMVRQDGAPWVALELRFGVEGEDPVVLELPGGEVRLRGAVDRVDDRTDGLRVVDYKTGGVYDFDEGTGAFNGGRRLQHALYAHAVEARLGQPVSAGEYHFPTTRGQNDVLTYPRIGLAGVAQLLDHMLDGVAEGRFVPTDEPNDCRFCDYAEVCRVRLDDFGKVTSPLAEWSKECAGVGVWPAFTQLRATRDFED